MWTSKRVHCEIFGAIKRMKHLCFDINIGIAIPNIYVYIYIFYC